ncbi:hypothetical protein KY329_00710 [Candidatus Woesearchaeota archaeon]|nr:hypothetical protein [Candidatus Woesearchaeota archaeon]
MNNIKCPKCRSPMTEKGTTTSANSKYANWECEVCGHKEIKCMGLSIINNGI